MKQILLFSLLILGSLTLSAQAPDSISFQAVIRAEDGTLLANQAISVRIEITKGATRRISGSNGDLSEGSSSNTNESMSLNGSSVYAETHQVSTNDNGLVSLIIGEGSVDPTSSNSGLSGIDWSDGPYYIKRSIDPEGGTNYSITGESQILSVPYALNAKSVSSDTVASVKGEYGTLIYAGDLNKSKEEVDKGKYLRISNNPDFRDFVPNSDSVDDDVEIYSMDDIVLNSSDDIEINSGYHIELDAERDIELYAKEEISLTTLETVTIRLKRPNALFRVERWDEDEEEYVILYEFPQEAPGESGNYVLGRASDATQSTTLSWIDLESVMAKTPNIAPSTLAHFEELEQKANEMRQQLVESLARILELEKLISNQQKMIETQLEWNKKLETKLQSN